MSEILQFKLLPVSETLSHCLNFTITRLFKIKTRTESGICWFSVLKNGNNFHMDGCRNKIWKQETSAVRATWTRHLQDHSVCMWDANRKTLESVLFSTLDERGWNPLFKSVIPRCSALVLIWNLSDSSIMISIVLSRWAAHQQLVCSQ